MKNREKFFMKNAEFMMALCLILFSCQTTPVAEKANSTEKALPDTSFLNKPIAAFDTSDYVVELKHMQEFYDVPGEFGHIAEGKDYGFKSLSIIMTNTQPNGGPPLHVHETEEAHIIHEGKMLYVMGDTILSATGPYIAKIPAGVPHTFINTGDQPLHLTAVFPSSYLSYKELGRNPLVKDTSVYHKH